MSQKDDDENTDDGIWRAAIGVALAGKLLRAQVSIPMTVLGGLQYGCHVDTFVFLFVSIPMTVFGGLQFDLMRKEKKTKK